MKENNTNEENFDSSLSCRNIHLGSWVISAFRNAGLVVIASSIDIGDHGWNWSSLRVMLCSTR